MQTDNQDETLPISGARTLGVLSVRVGSNVKTLPRHYRDWRHEHLDADPKTSPDIVLDAREMRSLQPGVYDALYSSHALQVFYPHDVPKVLLGFAHVLRDDGFAEICVPDMSAIAASVRERALDIGDVLVTGPLGPISVRDSVFGHAMLIRADSGDRFAHKTGFTERSLRKALFAAGFAATICEPAPQTFSMRLLAFKRYPNPRQQELLGVGELPLKRLHVIPAGLTVSEKTVVQGVPDEEIERDFQRAGDLQKQGRPDDAEELLRSILTRVPRFFPALINFGVILNAKKRYSEAISAYHLAIEVNPQSPAAHNNLGNSLYETGKFEDAAVHLYRATELDPNYTKAYRNLGNTLFNLNRFEESKVALEKAISLDPKDTLSWNGLGRVHLRQCRIDDAIASFRKALELEPLLHGAHSNVVFSMHFSSAFTPAEMAQEHKNWGERHANPLARSAFRHGPRDRSKKRLKVGFVSEDFKHHPVGYFLTPLFRRRNKDDWEAICYTNLTAPDQMTQWFQGQADQWRDISRMSDQDAAGLIRDDGIDILFDLAGHTGQNRLLVFALKPAPVQASWIGYFNTTGMEAVDYLLAERAVHFP